MTKVALSTKAVAATFAVVLSSLFLSTTLQAQASSCNPHRASGGNGPHHSGAYNVPAGNGTALGGIYGTIINEEPYTDINGDAANSGWVMLQNHSNANEFAQMGWYQTSSTSEVLFAESWGGTLTGSFWISTGSSQLTIGQADTYSVQTTGNGTFTFWYNGSYFDQVYNGLDTGSYDRLDEAAIANETHNFQSQMASDMLSPEQFSGVHTWYSNNWQNFGTGTPVLDEPYYAFNEANSAATSWDWGCPPHTNVFQDNSGNLHSYNSAGGQPYVLPMAGSTSPSIIATSGGGWLAAYQDNTTNLHTYTSGGTSSPISFGMKAGTSPAITPLTTGGWIIAVQLNTGQLATYTSGGVKTNLGQGMMAGTSPSITATSGGGWIIAFQANTGNLYTYTSAGTSTNRSQGMASSTSPSITTLTNGNWQIVFQANSNNLYSYTSGGTSTNTGQGMAGSTSPSITWTASSGWVTAFQDNTNNLHYYDSNTSSYNLSQGMQSGTSPSIATMANGLGWEMAFQANTHNLYTYSSWGGATNTSQGMSSTTSPANAPPS